MSWIDHINEASRKGYRVSFDEEADGWIITAPKHPRRPPEELGSYRDEQAAWHGAALLASQEGN